VQPALRARIINTLPGTYIARHSGLPTFVAHQCYVEVEDANVLAPGQRSIRPPAERRLFPEHRDGAPPHALY